MGFVKGAMLASAMILSVGTSIAGKKSDSQSTSSKSSRPHWASSTSFPQSPLMAFDGVVFTGNTNLNNRTFADSVLSRGPLRANGCTFTTVTIQGPFEGTNVTADQMTVQGMGYMIGGTIKNTLTVQGQWAARGTTVSGTAHFSGQAILEDVTIQGLLKGKGSLVARNSTFGDVVVSRDVQAADSQFGNLEMSGTRHSFENCTLSDVVVTGTKDNQSAAIYLKNVTVKGTITFESGKGTVYTTDKTGLKIAGGTIVSGK